MTVDWVVCAPVRVRTRRLPPRTRAFPFGREALERDSSARAIQQGNEALGQDADGLGARSLFRSANMRKPALVTIKFFGLSPKASEGSLAAIEEASKRNDIRIPPRPLSTPRRGLALNLRSQTAKRKRGSSNARSRLRL